MVFASTYHRGFHYLKWHFLRALIGFGALWVGTKLNVYRFARPRVRWVLLGATVVVLFTTLVFGDVVGVTKRNLLGVLQPAEFAKFVIIIYLAGYFSDLHNSGDKINFFNSLLKPGMVVAMVVGLTLLQPAVGTSVIITISSLMVFLVAGVRWRYLFLGGAIVTAIVIIGIAGMPLLRNTKYKYIPERWDKFINGDRYHQTQALIALGSGGPIGRGLGEGRQKYYFLPKLHKDFIFCTIGEELGFFGCLGIMLLYLVFFLRSCKIAMRTTQAFGQYLACGIAVVILLYALLHIAVSLSIVPTTGQPLPFISYGGSALVANLFAAGMVLKISKFRRVGIEESANGRRWDRWSYLSGARPRP